MLTYTFKKGSDTAVDLRSFPIGNSSFAVHVEKSTGIIGKPSLKAIDQYDWRYLHGTTPDLANRRYQNKEIALQCWMEADSKQQIVEQFDKFLNFFAYDDLMLMKVIWNNSDGYVGQNIPQNPKGLFYLVWLKSVSDVKYKWRFGRQIARFTLVFEDPYPVKRIYKYTGEDGGGVKYDIVSETEIDIFTDHGETVYDILSGDGDIACPLNSYILVCGDVAHVTDSNGQDDIITPTGRDTVTLIYEEL